MASQAAATASVDGGFARVTGLGQARLDRAHRRGKGERTVGATEVTGITVINGREWLQNIATKHLSASNFSLSTALPPMSRIRCVNENATL